MPINANKYSKFSSWFFRANLSHKWVEQNGKWPPICRVCKKYLNVDNMEFCNVIDLEEMKKPLTFIEEISHAKIN